MCQTATSRECATASEARLAPRRARTPAVLRVEVGVTGAGGGACGFDQRAAQPFGALAAAAGAALAGGFVVAGTDAGPGGEMRGGRECGHVAAGFGDQDFGGAALDAGDRAEQFDSGRERGDLLL